MNKNYLKENYLKTKAKEKQNNEKDVCWLTSNSQDKTVPSKKSQGGKVFWYVEYWTRKPVLSIAVLKEDIFFFVNEINLPQM